MTSNAPSVLCPIDFSEFSRLALAHAVVMANHFGARLIVLTVDEPLLAEAAAASGLVPSPADDTLQEVQRFCSDTLASFAGPGTVVFRVAVGKPATEILREARERSVDLIVMSSHGWSGTRKLFFGSTTERVLRETSAPVLITPHARRSFTSFSDLARQITGVIAPIDMTDASSYQMSVARGVASALSARLTAVHVLEPLFIPVRVKLALPGAESARRSRAEETLAALVAPHHAESIVLVGEPADAIVHLAAARGAGLIVMGLHSSGLLGPRMGSVTYRVLCQTDALVLALPPHAVKTSSRTLANSAVTTDAARDASVPHAATSPAPRRDHAGSLPAS
jgi:nucleotide-binding universal stress UspA family protein